MKKLRCKLGLYKFPTIVGRVNGYRSVYSIIYKCKYCDKTKVIKGEK